MKGAFQAELLALRVDPRVNRGDQPVDARRDGAAASRRNLTMYAALAGSQCQSASTHPFSSQNSATREASGLLGKMWVPLFAAQFRQCASTRARVGLGLPSSAAMTCADRAAAAVGGELLDEHQRRQALESRVLR